MKYLVFLFVVGLLATSCNSDDDNSITGKVNPPELRFTAEYNSDPLVMLAQDYDYEVGMDIKIQLFQFFISDVRLVDENGNETDPIIDIATVSFANNTNEAAAVTGVSIPLNSIAPGKYTGIKMGIGVSPDLNSTQPGDYTPGHPLSTDYWAAAGSYIFAKVEGNADLDGTGDFSTKLTFHIGGDPRYREVLYNKAIQVDPDGALPIEFTVDLKDVLVDESGEYVDFQEVTQIHHGTASTAVFMMDNLSSSIRLK